MTIRKDEKADRPIDLTEELVEVFNKEDLIAFFGFTVENKEQHREEQQVGQQIKGQESVGTPPLTGFCKVSRAKKGASSLNYVSLHFITDCCIEKTLASSQNSALSDFSHAMEVLSSDALIAAVAQIKLTIPVPCVCTVGNLYMKQIDLVAHESTIIDEDFVSQSLYPAIERLTGLKLSPLTMWEDEKAREPKWTLTSDVTGQSFNNHNNGDETFFSRIKKYFNIK